MNYRSEHYRLAVRALPCTLRIVPCSGPSILVHNDMQSLGKGRGVKSGDIGAAGCDSCHRALAALPRAEQQHYTMRGTIRTITALLEMEWLGWQITHKQLQREIAAR